MLVVDGVDRPFDVARYAADVFVDSPLGPVQLVALPRFGDPDAAVAQGSLLAPMPGSVLRIGAAVGDAVTAGQPLVWLEAMKMEHTVTAPGDGVLAELNVEVGQQVDVGAVLARVDSPEEEIAMSVTSFHRDRRTAGAAQGRRRDGRQLRPGLLPGEGPRRISTPTNYGVRQANSASSGSTCPRSTAAAARACTSCRW